MNQSSRPLQKGSSLKMHYTLLVVVIAAVLLVTSGSFTSRINLQIHSDAFINGLVKYQIYALIIATIVTLVIIRINPPSKQFLNIGQLDTIAEKEKWLGINGKTLWKLNGLQLLLFISIATGIFMFLAVKYTNSMGNFQWHIIPIVLMLSCTNALSEELIFRFGIVGGLFNYYPKLTIMIISAILFGLPHYLGNPGGVIGVLMSGLLGYILCKSTIETKGLSIAWIIHFVQDIIIFTALMMMKIK